MLPEIDATGCSATGAVSADKGDTISISPNGTHDVDEAKAVNTVIRLAKEIAGNLPLQIIHVGKASRARLIMFWSATKVCIGMAGTQMTPPE